MILDAQTPQKPAGVVFDHGTGKRIPFVIRCDFATGDYEAHVPAPNGMDVIVDPYTRRPVVRKGKAVGRLELIPFGKTHKMGVAPPKKVVAAVQPMTKDEKIAGMDQYKKCYFEVWRWRGDSERVVMNKWIEELKQSDFMDCFVLQKTMKPTGGSIFG